MDFDNMKKGKNKLTSLFSLIKEYINMNENKNFFLILFSDQNGQIIFENIKEKEYKIFDLKINKDNELPYFSD